MLNNRIYAIGGYTGRRDLTSVEAYNPVTKRWTYVSSMIHSRYLAKATVLNGEIYVVGGARNNT